MLKYVASCHDGEDFEGGASSCLLVAKNEHFHKKFRETKQKEEIPKVVSTKKVMMTMMMTTIGW